MTGAIWALAYDISNDDSQSYLDWFHQIHIPEKLARPGYRWATHFEGSATTPNMQSFIALFGGISTRIFLDPSPAQLKTKQDDLTREMMARRGNPFATILAYEWRDGSTPSTEIAVEAAAKDPRQRCGRGRRRYTQWWGEEGRGAGCCRCRDGCRITCGARRGKW